MTVRARILLKTDEGWSAPQVAQALDVAEGTVFRIKRRFAEEGLEGVLQDRPQAHRYRKLDDRGEAHLIALACSEPPEGHEHWTLRLLAGQVVELGLAPSLSHETVRLHLKKNSLKPWQKQEWCIPKVSAEFVAHSTTPLVCANRCGNVDSHSCPCSKRFATGSNLAQPRTHVDNISCGH